MTAHGPKLWPLLSTHSSSNRDSKAFYRLGALLPPIAQKIALVLGIAETKINLLVDSDGIRHTLAQHGLAKANAEIARGQIPIIDADLLDLDKWLHQPTAVYRGQVKPGKQPRIELHWEAQAGITVAIMEWRPGRQQLALVTMYKKKPAA